MSAPEAIVIARIPLANGEGERAVAVSDGVGLVFTVKPGGPAETKPDHAFEASDAVRIAKRVLAGDPRTTTAHATLRQLAGAVLLLDHQLTPRGSE